MLNQHPITPPSELVQQWIKQGVGRPPSTDYMTHFANCAAQWGAKEEFEACYAWIENYHGTEAADSMQEGRHKVSSLKEQALAALEVIPKLVGFESERDTIRAALEALDD